MKRISFFLALTLVIFSFGLANAEQSLRSIEAAGFWTDGGTTYINTGTPVHWDIRVVNTNGSGYMYLPGFTFVVSSTDGMTWEPGIVLDTLNMLAQTGTRTWGNMFPNYYWWNDPVTPGGTQPTGHVSDTASVSCVAFGAPALYDGLNAIGLRVSMGVVPAEGGHICLKAVGNDAPSGWEGAWNALGAGENLVPDFVNDANGVAWTDRKACYEVKTQPDVPTCPTGLTNIGGSHCSPVTADFKAKDPDGTDIPIWSLVGAPAGATITKTSDSTAHFSWQPTLAEVGTSISFDVVTTEPDGPHCALTVNVVVENDAPTFTSGCNKAYPVQVGVDFYATFTAIDNCPGDPKTFSVADDGGLPYSTLEFDGNMLHIVATDTGTFVLTMQVSDGVDASTCNTVTLNVSAGAPFQVRIEKTEKTPQGQFADVNVYIDNQIAGDFGGFDFLMAYDASALTFQGANVDNSPLFQNCDWEYFTYRFGPDGNCGSGCPSGMVHVVGIAETNNGPVHPSCWGQTPSYILFTLKFLVSNDRTLECMYVPIRFFWYQCSDNTVTNKEGTTLYISSTVKEYAFDEDTDYLLDIADGSVGFPTYQGAQDECLTQYKVAVEDKIDFINGGIDIVCSKDVDARGDVNLDGLGYTIADAVMFTNYFIYGIGAFGDYPFGSIAATDVNADGLTLSVADLVYLIRVIVGDAQPYADAFLKPTTVNAAYHINNGVVSVDEAMGAAVLHISGDVTPVLLAEGMEMKYAFNAETNITSAVVYSLKNNNFTGNFIDARGDVVDIEMATAKGNPVNGSLIPSDFALNQNYPNPFNPTTTIGFALPHASDYALTIFNVTGQVVATFTGHGDAGQVQVVWDASNSASGVYFYKLDADNFSATKKMVLLK